MFHEYFFDAVSFSAMALMAFAEAGCSGESKRTMTLDDSPYYIASLPPEPGLMALVDGHPPLACQRPKEEVVTFRKFGWRVESGKEYHAAWGYGPDTDTLVVWKLEIQYPPPPPKVVNLGKRHHVALRG